MSEWWVGRRGADPVGPVSTDTLVRGVLEHKVPDDALVCRVGEQQWQHLAQIEELWERIHPEQSRTNVTERPWFKEAGDSSPPLETLTDSDSDDTTRIFGVPILSARKTDPGPESNATRPAVEAGGTPTVPLATHTARMNAAAPAANKPAATASIPRPSASGVTAAKAPSPSFTAPASLAAKAAKAASTANSAGVAANVKGTESLKAVKAVIPPPRFGADRLVTASPIAAGPLLTKTPSTRPSRPPSEPAAARRPSQSPAARSSPGAFQAATVKPHVADKARQPIPPVPAAVIPVPKGGHVEAGWDDLDVPLTQTRPDRPAIKLTREDYEKQRRPAAPSAPTSTREPAPQRPPMAPRAQVAQVAPPAPPPVATPADEIPELEDDALTEIRDVQQLPLSQPPDDEDATVIRDVQQMPLSQPPDDDSATVIRDVQPLPVVQQSVAVVQKTWPSQQIPPALADLEKLARKNVEARAVASPEEKTTLARPALPSNAAAVRAARQPSAAVEPAELFDEDDEQPLLAARAAGYAGAHGPPDSTHPRPAAGTPAPPSVIVSQPQVPIDALGHLIQPHSELTSPAVRSLRPPGTVQISIGTLIVGALALVVLVLLAVLLLR